MVSAPAIETIEDAAEAARAGPPVRFRVAEAVSDEQMERWGDEFELWFEDGEEGEIIITGGAGGDSPNITLEAASQARNWVVRVLLGFFRDSQPGERRAFAIHRAERP